MTRRRVASVAEMPPGMLKSVDVDGVPICLVHAPDGNLYALSDLCTHEGQSLSEGEVWHMELECPRHSSRFDLKTGRVTSPPALLPIATYPVTVENEDVFIEI